jgi:hypothetical protein
MTIRTTLAAAALPIARPAAVAPTWGWALRRAGIGLAMMASMTVLAAYLAHASIEEPGPDAISIGIPAGPLLER